ncbi:hypothetical protein [Fulvimarina sp. MAC3]|uniref:hypothetical protein n=1 Tax=Fulvimarina sp. MAC3 TaxID=3148887 RepID=UPI0031FC77E1
MAILQEIPSVRDPSANLRSLRFRDDPTPTNVGDEYVETPIVTILEALSYLFNVVPICRRTAELDFNRNAFVALASDRIRHVAFEKWWKLRRLAKDFEGIALSFVAPLNRLKRGLLVGLRYR